MQKNLTKLTYRGFSVFIALVLQSQSTVANVKSSGLQIAQQPQPTATQTNNPGDLRSVPGLLDERKEFDAKGTPAAKAAVKQAESRDKQLNEEANKLAQQQTPEAYRQAILKYQERLKIWQQPEIKQAIPKKARFWEGLAYRLIGINYTYLNESQLSLEYAQKALVIFREFKSLTWEASTLRSIGSTYNQLGKYQEALEYYNQALEAFKAVKDLKNQAITLHSIAGIYHQFGETQKELDVYNQALQIQRAIPDLKEQADTLNSIAGTYSSLGEYQKALSYYNQALDIQRQRKDSTAEALVLDSIASVYIQLQQTQQALSLLNQALQALQKAEVNLSGRNLKLNLMQQAGVYSSISSVYQSQDNYPQAISSDEQAQAIYKKVQEPKFEAGSIINLALLYDAYLGNKQKAISLYKQAQSLYQSIPDKEGEADTLNSIADISYDTGEIQEALNYYQQALDIQRQLKLLPKQALTLKNFAKVYTYLGDYQRSVDTYKQALTIFKQIGDKGQEAYTLHDIGSVYQEDKQYQLSLDYYHQALQLSHQKNNILIEALSLQFIAKTYLFWKDNKDSYKLGLQAANELLTLAQKYNRSQSQGIALAMLAQIYKTSGEYPKALSYINQALSLSRKQGLTSFEPNLIEVQGDIYNSSKQPDKAIQAYNQKLALVRVLGNKTPQAKTLYKLAVSERDRGNLKEAEIYIQETIKIVEDVRGKVQGEDLRTSYFATVQNYYKFYVDDKRTAVLMQEFYQQMLQNGKSPNAALRAAQLKMWQQEEFRNPNYWAAFTILGEWR